MIIDTDFVSKHRNYKLTDDDVREIRKSKDRQKILARKYGVKTDTIQGIVSGRRRRNVK